MAEINCDPAALARASACYCFADEHSSNAVIIFLLNQISGLNLDKSALAERAKCFCYADQNEARAVITYLLCQIANQ